MTSNKWIFIQDAWLRDIQTRIHTAQHTCTADTYVRRVTQSRRERFVISISTYFVGSPKPRKGNVQTDVQEGRLMSSNLLHWNGRISIANVTWSNTRTFLSYVHWNRWFEFCRSRKTPVERYTSWMGAEKRHAGSALVLHSNICYGYQTFRRFCSAPLETGEV